jgi:FixJ family two-component response regulator
MSSTTNSTFLMSPDRPLWDLNSSESSNGDSYPEKVVISIVDDDESVRSALKRLIKSVGLKVNEFASAEDFLKFATPSEAACLVLDLQLPGMSGLELQAKLLAANCHIPIVFISAHGDGISAHGDGQARAQALAAGAIDFLQKPFSEKALFDAINSALFIQNRGASESIEDRIAVAGEGNDHGTHDSYSRR